MLAARNACAAGQLCNMHFPFTLMIEKLFQSVLLQSRSIRDSWLRNYFSLSFDCLVTSELLLKSGTRTSAICLFSKCDRVVAVWFKQHYNRGIPAQSDHCVINKKTPTATARTPTLTSLWLPWGMIQTTLQSRDLCPITSLCDHQEDSHGNSKDSHTDIFVTPMRGRCVSTTKTQGFGKL